MVLFFLGVFPSNAGQILKELLLGSGCNLSKFENKYPKKRTSETILEKIDETTSTRICRKERR